VVVVAEVILLLVDQEDQVEVVALVVLVLQVVLFLDKAI